MKFSHSKRATKLVLGIFFAALIIGGLGFNRAHTAQATTYPVTLKLLVILINFTDAPAVPFTKAQAQSLYFGATNSVSAFYKANSNNRITFTGDVAGPYTVTRASTSCSGSYTSWAASGLAAAQAAGFNPANYNYIQYDFEPRCADGTVGYGVYGTPGEYPPLPGWLGSAIPSWIFGYFYVADTSHEFGHNLGSSHADSILNGPAGYGDLSDVMGDSWLVAGYAPLMFNAPHQVNVGWVDPGEVQTVTTSGTFTLNSMESNTGLRVLKIAKPSPAPNMYYLSMRQATGVDANMPAGYLGGVNITTWQGLYNTNTMFQKLLTDGASYVDSANGVTVTQVSHTASTVTVSVITTPSTVCTRASPFVTTTPGYSSGLTSNPGVPAILTITVTNSDSAACSASTFTLSSAVPPGWTSSLSNPTLSLSPGQTQSVSLTVTPSPSAVPSPVPVNIFYNIQSPTSNLGFAMNFFVMAPTCTPAAPTLSSVVSGLTAPAGTALTYQFALKNNDSAGCTASTFIVAPQSLPSGWSGGIPASLVLAPGVSTTTTATITSPLATPAGTTTIQVKVTDPLNALHTATTPVNYGIPAIPCTRAAPSVTATPTEYSDASAGAAKSYTLSVMNNDSVGCTPSIFTLTPQGPGGWSGNVSPPNITLLGGAPGTIAATITSPSTAPSGTTTIPMQLDDTSLPSLHARVITSIKYGIPAICTRAVPVLSVFPASQTAPAGSQLSYTAQLMNLDSLVCGSSTFTITPVVPPGWVGSALPLSLLVSPSSFQQGIITVTSGGSAPDGNYPISVNVSDAAFPVHAASASATYTVGPLPPTPPPLSTNMSISATRTHSGGSSTLTWWVSAGLTSGITCSVSPASMIQSGGPASISGGGSITSWGSSASPITAQTNPITGTVTFTLSCSGAGGSTVKSVNATLVPTYQDI